MAGQEGEIQDVKDLQCDYSWLWDSTRMALGGRSKQFLDLLEMPAFLHTLHAFEQARRIHEIIVVGREEDIPDMESCIRAQGWKK